jgi:RND family efflux transporter MFP subunit
VPTARAPVPWGAWLAIGCLFLAGCQRQSAAPRGAKERPSLPVKQVKLTRAVARPLDRTLVALGSLAAHDRAALGAKVSGRLQSIAVDLGSPVRAGDKLAQIEPLDYQLRLQQAQAALAQARAALGLPLDGADDRLELEQVTLVKQARAVLNEAKANYERVTKLAADGIISQSEVDTVTATRAVALNRYETALEEARQRQALLVQRRAELEIARQQLADTVIAAPFDGAVQERHASPGVFLSAGAPVVTLVRMDPLRLRVEVPERDAAKVRLGQPVRVRIEGDSTIHHGEVKRLAPALDERSRMLLVEADVKNNGYLHPGSFARTEILVQSKSPAVTVAPEAIVVFAGLEKAFTVQGGKALEKRITVGDRSADWVEVLSGLEADEPVVLEPGNLQHGQPVTVVD